MDGRGRGLTDRTGASSGGILVRIKRERLDTAQRDFLGSSICAPHLFFFFFLSSFLLLFFFSGMEMGGDFYTGLWLEMIFIPRLRAYKSGVVLKSGGSDVEAAKRRPLLHVSQSNYFYIYISYLGILCLRCWKFWKLCNKRLEQSDQPWHC